MFTHFFIARPILSSVISLLIVLAGLVSMAVAPIEQYPDMAPPQVQVQASGGVHAVTDVSQAKAAGCGGIVLGT